MNTPKKTQLFSKKALRHILKQLKFKEVRNQKTLYLKINVNIPNSPAPIHLYMNYNYNTSTFLVNMKQNESTIIISRPNSEQFVSLAILLTESLTHE